MAYSQCHSPLTCQVTYNQIPCLALWTWNVQITVRCLSQDLDKNQVSKQTRNLHYSENLLSKMAVQWHNDLAQGRGWDVNTRCSPSTWCCYLHSQKPKHKPYQATQQQWRHGYFGAPPQYAGENKGENKSHKAGRKFFFLPFPVMWLITHGIKKDSTGLFHLFICFFFFILVSWQTKQALYCYHIL